MSRFCLFAASEAQMVQVVDMKKDYHGLKSAHTQIHTYSQVKRSEHIEKTYFHVNLQIIRKFDNSETFKGEKDSAPFQGQKQNLSIFGALINLKLIMQIPLSCRPFFSDVTWVELK